MFVLADFDDDPCALVEEFNEARVEGVDLGAEFVEAAVCHTWTRRGCWG